MPKLESIEQKVVLGAIFIIGLLLLLGWVVINEEGRMQAFTGQFASRSIERGAAIFQNNCSTCHGVNGEGIPSRAPALNNPSLFNGDRLAQLGWGGSLEDYVTNVVSAGRPNSGTYWNGNIMPTWGQAYGGPMRSDQVANVVNFVLNWKDTALDSENPPQIAQDFKLPGQDVAAALPAGSEPIGTDVAALVAELDARDPVGDPARGQQLYESLETPATGAPLGCSGCHLAGIIAPPTPGTATRAADRVATDPALAGYTVRQYLVESIVQPEAYTVAAGANQTYAVMPTNFGTLLTIDDLADLVAFLESQTE